MGEGRPVLGPAGTNLLGDGKNTSLIFNSFCGGLGEKMSGPMCGLGGSCLFF